MARDLEHSDCDNRTLATSSHNTPNGHPASDNGHTRRLSSSPPACCLPGHHRKAYSSSGHRGSSTADAVPAREDDPAKGTHRLALNGCHEDDTSSDRCIRRHHHHHHHRQESRKNWIKPLAEEVMGLRLEEVNKALKTMKEHGQKFRYRDGEIDIRTASLNSVPLPPSMDHEDRESSSSCSNHHEEEEDDHPDDCDHDYYEYDTDEDYSSPDSDSTSDHGSTTSSSTANAGPSSGAQGASREGRVCDCCYCEVFGHGMSVMPPSNSKYNEMRDRLRSKLNKRKAANCKSIGKNVCEDHFDLHPCERIAAHSEPQEHVTDLLESSHENQSHGTKAAVDDRSLDDLLSFIEGTGSSKGSKGKGAATATITSAAMLPSKGEKKKSKQKSKKTDDKNPTTPSPPPNGSKHNSVPAQPPGSTCNKKPIIHPLDVKSHVSSASSSLKDSTTSPSKEVKEAPKVKLSDSKKPLSTPVTVAEMASAPIKTKTHSQKMVVTAPVPPPPPASTLGAPTIYLKNEKKSVTKQETKGPSPDRNKTIHTNRYIADDSPKASSQRTPHFDSTSPIKISPKPNGNVHSPSNENVPIDKLPSNGAKKDRVKRKKGQEDGTSPDEVFLPKDIDLDNGDLDEAEKELEAWKRTCFNTRPLKDRIKVNLKDFSLLKKKAFSLA